MNSTADNLTSIINNAHELGISSAAINNLDTVDLKPLLRNNPNTNKGNFGSIAIIGGSANMHGSIYLSGRAAMLCGSGKVTLASLDKNFACDPIMPELLTNTPEYVLQNINDFTCIVIGPGLGQSSESTGIIQNILNLQPTIPLIFDADALNIIATHPTLQQQFKQLPNKIITPHPMEASRLLSLEVTDINTQRVNAIKKLYDKYHAATLLKGHNSLIYNGNNLVVNPTGNPGMSNAGQGDTLCGIIAAMIAQSLDLFTSLRLGVYIHGAAGDCLANTKYHGHIGILASDVALQSRLLLNQILKP